MFGRRKNKADRPSGGMGLLPRHGGVLLKAVAWLVVLAGLGTGGVLGMRALERRILSAKAVKSPIVAVRVWFTKCPAWLPLSLAREIAYSLVPNNAQFQDIDLTADVYTRAKANPWIRQVRYVVKRKTQDPRIAGLEVDCEFRKPIARVKLSGEDAYVDVEAVRLPARDVPQWVVEVPASSIPACLPRQPSTTGTAQLYFRDNDALPANRTAKGIHYIAIVGVQAKAPPVGKPLQGQDIREGLKLVQLVLEKSYANQITTVDVRNYDGRISRREPHLCMRAQVGDGPSTDIKFGRFPVPEGGDYEVSPEQKMSYLDEYYLDNNRTLAGREYIDLQNDELHYSVN
jgi:hypothetical protein